MKLLPFFFFGEQPAAEMAFVQVAAGVFQMRASQVVALLVEEGTDRQKENSQETTNRETAGDTRKCSRYLVSQNNASTPVAEKYGCYSYTRCVTQGSIRTLNETTCDLKYVSRGLKKSGRQHVSSKPQLTEFFFVCGKGFSVCCCVFAGFLVRERALLHYPQSSASRRTYFPVKFSVNQ